MAVTDVEIYVDAHDVQVLLAHLQIKLQYAGLEEFLTRQVVPWLRGRAVQRFASEGDDVSGKWSPLSRATQMIRAKKGFPPQHPINVRTGGMRNFLEHAAGQIRGSAGYATLNWPGNVGRTRDIDTKIRTAQGLTSGTPPRPVIGVGDPDNIFVQSKLLAYLLS